MTSDEELLRRIVDRDEGAFDAFFARHTATVRARLIAMLRDPASADDVLQELFLRVWQQADRFDGRGSAAGWLGRMATNLALNHMRSRRRRSERPLPKVTFDDEDEDKSVDLPDARMPPPDKIAAAAEQIDLVAALVARLDTPKRDVWRMLHEQDLNIAGIAKALGIPPGTVKSRLYHARKALAAAWEEIEDEPGSTT